MNSEQYIPLDINDVIGGNENFLKIFKKISSSKNIIFIILLFFILVFIGFMKSKCSKKSKSTSNSKSSSNSVIITKRIETNGEVTLVKKVNGVEVKITDDDLKMIKKAESKVDNKKQ